MEAKEPGSQFSVMMWTLKNLATFESNLETVAQAGYKHVELVGEFARWLGEDWRRILARMSALKITVDATSGMKLGFAGPVERGRVCCGVEGHGSDGAAPGMRADHSVVGEAD